MSRYFVERDLKNSYTELMDAIVQRERPNDLEETQYIERSDLEVWGKMREMQTALTDYVDEYENKIKELEKSINELNTKLLRANGVVE